MRQKMGNRNLLGAVSAIALLVAASPSVAGGVAPAEAPAPVAPAPVQTGPQFLGTVTLGYNMSNIGGLGDIGDDLDIGLRGHSLDIETDILFSPSFAIGIDAGFASTTVNVDIDGLGDFDAELDLISLAVEPVFRFGNGAYAGVYYRAGDFDASIDALIGLPITIGVDTDSYGFFGGYDSGPIWLEGWYGVSDSDPGLPGDVDITDFGLAASYDVGNGLGVFGSAIHTNIGVEGPDFDVTFSAYSLGSDYDFGNGFVAYGSAGMLNIDLDGDADFSAHGFTIGGSYELSSMGTPVMLSAEYSRTTVDISDLGVPNSIEPEINRFAVGLTIPLGRSSEPLNSNTRTARGDYRSAIAALVQSF